MSKAGSSDGRTALLWAVLVLYALLSADYGRAWRSELTLWAYAAPLAPRKPRPHLQWVLALMEARRFTEARIVLAYVDRLDLTGRPVWDRRETREAVIQLRHVVSRLDPVYP